MKPLAKWLLWAVVLAFVVRIAIAARSVAASYHRTPVSVTRIYTGPDGQTHVEQLDLRLAPNPAFGRDESDTVKVTSSYFARLPPGFVQNWHPAADRRYVVSLSGRKKWIGCVIQVTMIFKTAINSLLALE